MLGILGNIPVYSNYEKILGVLRIKLKFNLLLLFIIFLVRDIFANKFHIDVKDLSVNPKNCKVPLEKIQKYADKNGIKSFYF